MEWRLTQGSRRWKRNERATPRRGKTMNDRIELAIVKGATSGVVALTDTHLILADDTTYEQWFEGLKAIKWYKDKLAIGFADYLVWGRNKSAPEKVDVAIEQVEFELSYVKAADLIN